VVVKLANKRTTGPTRKRKRSQSERELQELGSEQKVLDQELEGPAVTESDKEKATRESASEGTPISPERLEPPPQTVEPAPVAQARQSKQVQVKPESGQKSGGKRVAENREGVFESFTKMNESVFSLEGVKKAAAWYIETSEKLANQALELQERATGWAKDTPFAPLFEAQHSIARKFVERTANAARTLWQLQPNQ
jgi:hypothetical protein